MAVSILTLPALLVPASHAKSSYRAAITMYAQVGVPLVEVSFYTLVYAVALDLACDRRGTVSQIGRASTQSSIARKQFMELYTVVKVHSSILRFDLLIHDLLLSTAEKTAVSNTNLSIHERQGK